LEIKISRRIAIAWAIPAFAGAFAIGFVGLSLYGRIFADPEFLMPFIATKLLPSWIAGIFISGAVAAMMSTADSQLLVITSTVVEDFYHKALNKDVSQKKLLSLSRIVTVLIGIFGFILAVTSKKLIFSLVSYAWAGLGASFGPALILMLKWKKTTSQGVLAGMITGTMTTVIWSEIAFLDNFISVRFTSFVFAFIAVIIVSILTQEKTISNN
jgi:sodium/proline symporter